MGVPQINGYLKLKHMAPGPTLHVLITTHVPIKGSVKHKGPKEQSEERTFQGIK